MSDWTVSLEQIQEAQSESKVKTDNSKGKQTKAIVRTIKLRFGFKEANINMCSQLNKETAGYIQIN